MEVRIIDMAIDKMKRKLLQVNRNPFLPEQLKNEKLREITKWIKDTETVRNNFVHDIMKRGT